MQVVARYCGLHKVTRTEEGKFACDCKSYMKMQVRMTLRAQVVRASVSEIAKPQI